MPCGWLAAISDRRSSWENGCTGHPGWGAPAVERSQVAVIIPAWNEGKTIGRVVKAVSLFATALVVDDCSTDDTAVKAREEGAFVVSHETNKGYDGALNTGFERAVSLGFAYGITFDADGQHSSDLLAAFLAKLESGMDMVLGVRPKHARFAEHVFALSTRLRFGIRDPLCGMKGYRLSVYAARGWFDSYGSVGTELALWAARNGYSYCQIPVPIAEREDSPRFGRVWRANMKILRAMYKSYFLKEGD